jgi:hypothetical protein
MSRFIRRSSLLLFFAVSVSACSGGPTSNVTPQLPDTTPVQSETATGSMVTAQASTTQVTIQGPVTSIAATPYFHVVATISGKGNVSIYSSYLTKAKVGNVVKATGFYNSLGNFQASSASIVSATTASSPAPSSAPSATPKPTAAPTFAPTAAPVSGAGGVAGTINMFQIFDYGTTAAQSTAAAKNTSAVWGAGVGNKGATPKTWLAGNSGLTAIQYFVQPTDEYPVSGHTLAWFQAYHPDWIVYDCDTNNQPTRTVAYEPSLPNDVPLDIHNPAVVKYQIETAANFAIARGANAIGADQTLFFDYDGGQQPGWYGCGIYQNGTFVRRWGAQGGGFPNHDPQWNHDVAAWAVTAKQILATDTTLASHHIKLFVNHPAGNVANVDEQTLIANIDGLVDETGFIDYGHYPQYPSLFKTALTYMEYVQHQDKTILETAKFTGSLNGDSSDFGLTTAQVAYAMGSYLIGNEGRASLFITPGPYGTVYSFPQIATINSQLGTSCGSFTTAGAAYVRKFSHGMVVVNPSTSSAAVPLGGVYTDVMGRSVTGTTLTVGPANAYILLGTGGC